MNRRETYVPRGPNGMRRMFLCALLGHKWVRFNSTVEVCARCSDGRHTR